MTRNRALFLTLAVLPLTALGQFLALPLAKAQSNYPDYLPPQQLEPPRSIRPPQASGNGGSDSSRSGSYADYTRSNGGGSSSSSSSSAAYTPKGADNPGYGQPYTPGPSANAAPMPANNAPPPDTATWGPPPQSGYSPNEILDAGRGFFGGASEGLAKVVEHAFQRNGQPTGYILGEEGSGAIIAGLRYGEGTLYTKGSPPQKVYWQGPTLGYDLGANGSKSFTLVYNLLNPSQIYERFAGVDGSAYLVGGVGITFQQHDDVILAPIRAGLGLRLGANVGYLKYTPSPTWNPF